MIWGFFWLDRKCKVLYIYWSLQCILAMPYCWQRYFKDHFLYEKQSIQISSHAYGAYKCTCHIYVNYEQPIHWYFFLDFIMAVFLDNILMYSCTIKEHFILLEKLLVCYISIHSTVSLRSFSFLYNSTMLLSF